MPPSVAREKESGERYSVRGHAVATGRWDDFLRTTMNPKLIRDKDVSNLLTWKYSLSNKRPLIVCVDFVALKTANGQARQSKADE